MKKYSIDWSHHLIWINDHCLHLNILHPTRAFTSKQREFCKTHSASKLFGPNPTYSCTMRRVYGGGNSRSPRSRSKLEVEWSGRRDGSTTSVAHRTSLYGKWRTDGRCRQSGNNLWEWPWKWNPQSWEDRSHLHVVTGLKSVLVRTKYVFGLFCVGY